MSNLRTLRSSSISVSELAVLTRRNFEILLLVPVIAGFLALVVASALPKYYTSFAFLRFSRAETLARGDFMVSNTILDKALTKIDVPGERAEARRKFLAAKVRLFIPHPNRGRIIGTWK